MKFIKILIIIIILLSLIFIIKIFTKKNNNEMTLEQIKELVNNSEKINNYSCEYEIAGSKILKIVNDNNEKIITETEKNRRNAYLYKL